MILDSLARALYLNFVSPNFVPANFNNRHISNSSDSNGKVEAKYGEWGNRQFTVDAFVEHLEGNVARGISPVGIDDKCKFAVIDIDCYKENVVRAILKSIQDYRLPFVACRSKSGGLHLYRIYARRIPAKEARASLAKFVQIMGWETVAGKSAVEIFPKSDHLAGNGHCITLPYFNAADTKTYAYNTDCNFEPVTLDEAPTFFKNHTFTMDDEKKALTDIPYSDAPPCIQRLILSGAVNAGFRNEFLFSYGIYMKKKDPDNYRDRIRDFNSTLDRPLEEREVEGLISSIAKTEAFFKCSSEPLCSCCNKTLCREREFGVGGDKSHFLPLEYGRMFIHITKTLEETWYEWELRFIPDDGEEPRAWKRVAFRSIEKLTDPKAFTNTVAVALQRIPNKISEQDLKGIINCYLPMAEEVKEAADSDTSDYSIFEMALFDYCRHCVDSPYQVATMCYRTTQNIDGNMKSVYYFTIDGFRKFLFVHGKNYKFNLSRLSEYLIAARCYPSELAYRTLRGTTRTIPCRKLSDMRLDDAFDALEEEKEYLRQNTLSIENLRELNSDYNDAGHKIDLKNDIGGYDASELQ